MRSFPTLGAALFAAAALVASGPAAAGMMHGLAAPTVPDNHVRTQFRLPFGMSAERMRRQLERDGYDEIEVTYVGIVDAKADACRDGKRYRVKLRIDGNYEYRKEIGRCRRQVNEAQLEALLRDRGYSSIDINEEPPGSRAAFVATACRDRRRFELEIDEFGDISRDRNIGQCERELLSPRQVRAALRKDGFDRIKFTDRTPPRYIVEACRDNTRVRLVINRRGQVRDRKRIGRCAPRIDPKSIEVLLERDGYDRVDVVDRNGPRYRAEACKGLSRMRMVISPWGDRLAERRIGDCDPPITLAQLEQQLEEHPEKRFRNVRVRQVNDPRYPFVARACVDDRRWDLYFTKWGQFGDRKPAPGGCQSPRLSKVMQDLRESGHRRIRTFIEACQRRQLYRIEIDEYGDEVNRVELGRCGFDRPR